MHLLKFTWLLASSICFLLGVMLLGSRLVGLGIKDSRWNSIAKTGLPATLEGFQWSDWMPNDGQIAAFAGFKPHQKKGPIEEFRIAKAKSLFFDFVFYQGRYTHENGRRIVPATGPFWGTHWQESWAWSALITGGVLYLVYILTFGYYGQRYSSSSEEHSYWTE